MHAHTFPRPVDSSANLLLLFMSISSCCYFFVFLLYVEMTVICMRRLRCIIRDPSVIWHTADLNIFESFILLWQTGWWKPWTSCCCRFIFQLKTAPGDTTLHAYLLLLVVLVSSAVELENLMFTRMPKQPGAVHCHATRAGWVILSFCCTCFLRLAVRPTLSPMAKHAESNMKQTTREVSGSIPGQWGRARKPLWRREPAYKKIFRFGRHVPRRGQASNSSLSSSTALQRKLSFVHALGLVVHALVEHAKACRSQLRRKSLGAWRLRGAGTTCSAACGCDHRREYMLRMRTGT